MPALNSLQLFDQVFWVLLRQFRVDRRARVAICTVARCTNSGKAGFAFDQIWLGRRLHFCLSFRFGFALASGLAASVAAKLETEPTAIKAAATKGVSVDKNEDIVSFIFWRNEEQFV